MKLALVGLLAVAGAAGLACSEDAPASGSGGSGGAQGGAGGQGGAFDGGGGAGGEEPTCAFDVMTDPAHCGACDNPCAPGQSCEAGSCVCDPGLVPPDWTAVVEPIFLSRCAGAECHDGPLPQHDLVITPTSDPHGQMVGVLSYECGSQRRLLVEPGHPERSHVMDKLLGVRICSGVAMPIDDPLTALELRTISDWICGGALP